MPPNLPFLRSNKMFFWKEHFHHCSASANLEGFINSQECPAVNGPEESAIS